MVNRNKKLKLKFKWAGALKDLLYKCNNDSNKNTNIRKKIKKDILKIWLNTD